jgi:hypothetical protein
MHCRRAPSTQAAIARRSPPLSRFFFEFVAPAARQRPPKSSAEVRDIPAVMMNTNRLAIAAALSEEALLARLAELAAAGHNNTADMVAVLAELARRKQHRGEGEGSLFKHCTLVLRLSQAAAWNRIAAAYAALKYPIILDLLADGSVNLTTIRVLAPHLTPGNHLEALHAAIGKTKEEVEKIKARLNPQPDVAPVVRKLPAPVQPTATPAADLFGGTSPTTEQPAATPKAAPPPPRPVIAPLSPSRYGVHFTIGDDTREKLRRVQDLMRREIPKGDLEAIFDRAIDLLLAQAEKKAFHATSKPRPARGVKPGSRTIPAHVERAVWARDEGRCAFIGRTGIRCSERTFLDFHHVLPHGTGGPATIENIALRCRAHNAYEAELVFGRFGSRADREWLRIDP